MNVTTADPAGVSVAGRRAHRDLHFEVEQLYYQEAELLDDGRYADWLEMLADDLDYWMPTRTNRLRRPQALSVPPRPPPPPPARARVGRGGAAAPPQGWVPPPPHPPAPTAGALRGRPRRGG